MATRSAAAPAGSGSAPRRCWRSGRPRPGAGRRRRARRCRIGRYQGRVPSPRRREPQTVVAAPCEAGEVPGLGGVSRNPQGGVGGRIRLGVSLRGSRDHARGGRRYAAYIGNWLNILREEKRVIFSGAARAQRAAEYLHQPQPAPECGAGTTCKGKREQPAPRAECRRA
jgi:hypothetical protein